MPNKDIANMKVKVKKPKDIIIRTAWGCTFLREKAMTLIHEYELHVMKYKKPGSNYGVFWALQLPPETDAISGELANQKKYHIYIYYTEKHIIARVSEGT